MTPVIKLPELSQFKGSFSYGTHHILCSRIRSRVMAATLKWNQMAEDDALSKYIALWLAREKRCTHAGWDSRVFNSLYLQVLHCSDVLILLMSWQRLLLVLASRTFYSSISLLVLFNHKVCILQLYLNELILHWPQNCHIIYFWDPVKKSWHLGRGILQQRLPFTNSLHMEHSC